MADIDPKLYRELQARGFSKQALDEVEATVHHQTFKHYLLDDLPTLNAMTDAVAANASANAALLQRLDPEVAARNAVSYTHLTLPTNREG